MRSSILILIAAFLLVGMDASAAAFIKFQGVEGESQDKDHVGWCDLTSIQWGVGRAVTPASGQPAGKRQHKPISIVKPLDKATPLLMQECSDGKGVDRVEIHLTRVGRDGAQETYLIINMKDVIITSYDMASGNDASGEPMPPMEQLELTYRNITWTWVEGGAEYSDDWLPTR